MRYRRSVGDVGEIRTSESVYIVSWSGIAKVVHFFFFNDTATTEIYTLSLHDALPICDKRPEAGRAARREDALLYGSAGRRSEEHTSELQSRSDLVCRLLLEKKKQQSNTHSNSPRETHSSSPTRLRTCSLCSIPAL